jgi:hypothetical protein
MIRTMRHRLRVSSSRLQLSATAQRYRAIVARADATAKLLGLLDVGRDQARVVVIPAS